MRAPRLARKENQDDMGAFETVRCELQYSRLAAGTILALGIASAAVAASLPLPAWIRLAAVAAVVVEAMLAWARIRAVRFLAVRREGEVRLGLRDGRVLQGRLRPGAFVAPWLTLVRWRPEGARVDRTVVLLPGIADAQALRKLRVILRWA
jgi:hypothetical protein